MAYQTHDLVQAMWADARGAQASAGLRVDGGLAGSDWTMQFLADMLRLPVERAESVEATAMGVAYLAGWRAGLYADPLGAQRTFQPEHRFEPACDAVTRCARLSGWHDAVARLLHAPVRAEHAST